MARRRNHRAPTPLRDGWSGLQKRGAAMLLVAVVVVVVAFVGLGLFALSNDLGTAVDFPFTVYQGEEVLGGSELRFSEVLSQGKPVVLNFWGWGLPPVPDRDAGPPASL